MSKQKPQVDLIDFLNNPDNYPHKPTHVHVLQTHASLLAVVPPYVYKIKKQVDLGFMDFRSLDSRKENFKREMELNSRLCAELYLEIVPISVKKNYLIFGPGERIVDYALKMKQLPDGYFLDQLIYKNQAGPEVLDQVMLILKNFYEQQQGNSEIEIFGKPSHVQKITDENFQTLFIYTGATVESESLEALSALTRNFLEKNKNLLEKRIEDKKIKDGHGDLRLEHIHIYNGKICIYDCLEFNDHFRYIDIACDIAFLAMDLDFHLRPDLSKYLAEKFSKLIHDPDLLKMMDFYKSYRACVRAKVESIKYSQPEVPEEQSKESKDKAQKYLSLAIRYISLGSGPFALMICGNVGSGKSTIAKKLAELLNIEIISSDIIRKKSEGLPLNKRTNPQDRKSLYSTLKSEEVYANILETAQTHLKNNSSVVIDATFSKSSFRNKFIQSFSSNSIPYCFVEMQALDQTTKERLYRRNFTVGVTSDARLKDYEKLKAAYEPVLEIPQEHYLSVSSEMSLSESIVATLKKLGERNFNM
ncbi:bifunctional aminoglycoside phosphotransferase/ATP-binding protein [soil metagenome]